MMFSGWGLFAFCCLLFLLWFGNYTASKYAKLYSFVPMPPQIESEPWPADIESPRYYEPGNYATSMCCSVVTTISMQDLMNIRPGGIIKKYR